MMAFVTIIVPERILYLPRFKTICFHPSLLPRHRGASGINWAIIEGDAETGVTWFWPDRGIDTGPILIQRRVPIGPADTTGSIYFNTLFPMGIETMVEAVDLIAAGNAPSIPQDESLATYEAPCRDEHAAIDFRATGKDGLQPGARMRPAAGRFRNARRTSFASLRRAAGVERRQQCAGHHYRHRSARYENSARQADRCWCGARGSIRVRRRSRLRILQPPTK